MTATDPQAPDAAVLAVLCTCPDEDTAQRLGAGLVEAGLAACVNVLPSIRSIYRWKGTLQNDQETLMIIKTSRPAYRGLEAWLLERHPYDTPEVLALPVAAGSPAYLSWVLEGTGVL